MAAPFVVLVVCRANVCRSPLAAALIQRYVREAGLDADVGVRSAGTSVLDGLPMCGEAAAWAGVTSTQISTPVIREDLVNADLVLAADRETRAACAILEPGCRPRLFTLTQAAVLADVAAADADADAESGDRLRWLVGEWDAERVLLAGRDEDRDDVADRHGPAPHPEVFHEVDEASRAIATAFRQVCRH
ncbi:MAG: hypothetical protein PSX37_08980 [bacterium]|nr:hypothetical protein [bacterium]